MPSTDLWEIVGIALACSVPIVVLGAIVIRVARSWSLTLSMVVLILIPTLATFTGFLGAGVFMASEWFERVAVVLVIVSVVGLSLTVGNRGSINVGVVWAFLTLVGAGFGGWAWSQLADMTPKPRPEAQAYSSAGFAEPTRRPVAPPNSAPSGAAQVYDPAGFAQQHDPS